MSRLPFPPRTPQHKMMAGLSIGILALLAVILSLDAPWKGLAAKTIKRGKPFGVEEYMQVGLWWSGVGVAIFLAILLVSLPLWWKWTERATDAPAPEKRKKAGWEWAILAGAVLVAGILRFSLADQSVLHDEHDNLRRNYHGFTAIGEGNKGDVWHPAGYREALFENARGNNPFLYSLLSHASIDAWRVFSGAPRDRFNVTAMRIPSLLAGMGGILTAWLLARRIGGAKVAALAVWLMAIHPLHVKYSVEARGYSIVLLFAPVFLLCCLNVVERGRWKDAFGVSFTAATMLYAYPGAAYFVGASAVGLVAAFLWKGNADLRGTLVRVVISGSLALGLLIFLIAPGLLQATSNLDNQFAKTGLPPVWHFQMWHWMGLGLHLPADQEYYDLRDGVVTWSVFLPQTLRAEPFAALLGWLVLPILILIGARQWWRMGRAYRPLVVASLGGPLLFLCHHGLITHFAVFQWYMIYALPSLMIFASSGLFSLLEKKMDSEISPKQVWIPASVAVAIVGMFWLASHHPSKHHPVVLYTPWETDAGLPTARNMMHRGPNYWETWMDGRVLRLDKMKDGKKPAASDGDDDP